MIVAILPMLLGGLAIFIYSISKLSETLRSELTAEAKTIIGRYTRNVISGVLIGTILTLMLGSSSAVIIIAIIFVNAHTLTFKQAIGIVMGANIGTTFSSQLISLDIGKYAFIPLIIGLIIQLASKKYRRIGTAILYFGLLFFGLFVMEHSVEPIKDSKVFVGWMKALESPLQGALIGGLITFIIQSSSATVGIAITLGKQQLISIAGGVAVMLGAELGTCSDTLIATIGGTREGIRTGFFHLLFNFITITVGLVLFTPFIWLVKWITPGDAINAHIANAHMLFNVLGVLLFLPFVGSVSRLMMRIIPENNPPPTLPSPS